MDGIQESESTALINTYYTASKKSPSSAHPRCEASIKYIRFVSAEVVVFSFVSIFYYYQNYTQQYFFQWFASEALSNATGSANATVCYNQTLINKLSGSNSTIDEVEGKAAHMNLMITLAKYIPSLIVNLVISPLSDKYGRKPAMVLVLTGEVLAVVLGVIITYLALNIYWFILCGFLLGFSGGVSTLMSVSFAYISDITPQRWRTVHLGFLQAVVYTSIALSSGIFNIWLQGTNCNFKPPSWLMVAIALAGLVYSLLMPESLPKKERLQFSQSKNGISVLLQGVKMFFWPRSKYSVWRLWFVALSIFVVVFGESGENAITTLFLLHKPLEWNRNLIGIYQILRSISHALALFLLLPLFLCLKFPDPLVTMIGIAITIGANIFLGFVTHTWEMFLVGLLQGIESLLLPTLLGMSSKIVKQEDQGALFSILSTFSLLSALFGSMAYSMVYPYTLKHGLPPGSSYWLMAIIWTTPIPLLLLIWRCGRSYSINSEGVSIKDAVKSELNINS